MNNICFLFLFYICNCLSVSVSLIKKETFSGSILAKQSITNFNNLKQISAFVYFIWLQFIIPQKSTKWINITCFNLINLINLDQAFFFSTMFTLACLIPKTASTFWYDASDTLWIPFHAKSRHGKRIVPHNSLPSAPWIGNGLFDSTYSSPWSSCDHRAPVVCLFCYWFLPLFVHCIYVAKYFAGI